MYSNWYVTTVMPTRTNVGLQEASIRPSMSSSDSRNRNVSRNVRKEVEDD
jgi:hypothetical protein